MVQPDLGSTPCLTCESVSDSTASAALLDDPAPRPTARPTPDAAALPLFPPARASRQPRGSRLRVRVAMGLPQSDSERSRRHTASADTPAGSICSGAGRERFGRAEVEGAGHVYSRR